MPHHAIIFPLNCQDSFFLIGGLFYLSIYLPITVLFISFLKILIFITSLQPKELPFAFVVVQICCNSILQFLFIWKCLYIAFILKDIFTNLNLGWLLFLQHFKGVLKPAGLQLLINSQLSFAIVVSFFRVLSRFFSWTIIFNSLTMTYLSVTFLYLSYLEFTELVKCVNLHILPIWGKFQPLLSYTSRTPLNMWCWTFWYSTSHRGQLHFLKISFTFSDWMISTDLSSSLTLIFSKSYITPSNEFLFHVL